MKLNYFYAESTEQPVVVETSNSGTVFLRKDITSETRVDEEGRPTIYWCYQEAKLTSEEFAAYANLLTALNSNNIDTIKTSTENSGDNQLTIMEALADLYVMISELL